MDIISTRSLPVSNARRPKPLFGSDCNQCGYCCSVQPCALAEELLQCTIGPCVALEADGDKFNCGLVRNPLAYLFQASRPGEQVDVLSPAPNSVQGHDLSSRLAAALGLGHGCDASDDADSAAWNHSPADTLQD